jgi:ribonuclease HI
MNDIKTDTDEWLEHGLNEAGATETTVGPIIIFCDGACIDNPGPGGFAAVIMQNGSEQIISGQDPDTTNSRMEMLAAVRALEATQPGSTVKLYSDSQMLIKGMTEWMAGWKRRGWINSARKPVANRDLWEALDRLDAERQVEWNWVRGHAGNELNERVDGLAEREAELAAQQVRKAASPSRAQAAAKNIS